MIPPSLFSEDDWDSLSHKNERTIGMTNDFGDDSGEKLVDWMIRIGQDAGEAAMMASGERLATAFKRARGDEAIEGGVEADLGVAEWAKLDLFEFTSLPEHETIRQVIDEKLSREGIRHEFAPMPEGEHLVFMVEDAPAVNDAFKDLEKTTRTSVQRAEKELSQMRERVKGEPIAEKAAHAREASSRLEAAKGKSREMSRGVEMRSK